MPFYGRSFLPKTKGTHFQFEISSTCNKKLLMLKLKTSAFSQIHYLLHQIFVLLMDLMFLTDNSSSCLLPSLWAQTTLFSSQRYVRKPVGSAFGFFSLSLSLTLEFDRHLATVQPIERQHQPKSPVLFFYRVWSYCLPVLIIKSFSNVFFLYARSNT